MKQLSVLFWGVEVLLCQSQLLTFQNLRIPRGQLLAPGVFLYSSLPPATSRQPQLPTLSSSLWDKHSENILSPLLIVLLVPTLMSPSQIFGSFTALQGYGIIGDFWQESRDRNIHSKSLERD